jgi:polyphosphate kinase
METARAEIARLEDTAEAGSPGPGPGAAEIAGPSDPRLYVNRELSLLAFQRRVFEEARDPSNPLLERVRFLSIVASNLDEFFMIRVAGLAQQVASGVTERSADGLTPSETLAAVRHETLEIGRALRRCWRDELLPSLEEASRSASSRS